MSLTVFLSIFNLHILKKFLKQSVEKGGNEGADSKIEISIKQNRDFCRVLTILDKIATKKSQLTRRVQKIEASLVVFSLYSSSFTSLWLVQKFAFV